MGCGNWTAQSWSNYATTRGVNASATVDSLYTRKTMRDEFNPKGVIRESCDSDDHPNSTPIMIGLDVTGSMGAALEAVAKKLGDTMDEILNRNPVEDPQIMFAAIGDQYSDDYPLQVTQFESDIRIAEQLNDIYFERGGGGNGGESYPLAWYFAARHTKIDSFDKHNKKGFIFTVGDESYHNKIEKDFINKVLGDTVEADIDADEILAEVSRKYEIYHLIVKPVYYQNPVEDWGEILGNKAVLVENIDNIPEIIVSILELHAGKTVDEVTNSWSGDTSLVVRNAITDLAITKGDNGLVEF